MRKLQLRDEIDIALTKIGLNKTEIEQTHIMFDQYLLWDHGLAIIGQLQKSDKADDNSLNRLRNPFDLSIATPEEFEDFQKSLSINDLEIDEKISDLKYFLSNKKLRRPELWLKEE